MDKKFLKILALSAIIVTMEGSIEKIFAGSCENLYADTIICKQRKDCKVVRSFDNTPMCFTKCSLYTKAAKQARAKDKMSKTDFCDQLNNACAEGKWLGMFKCRNKFVPKGFSPDEID
ncbi:MAG: hypothetical protein KBD90_05360 [Alphaproteobacteria bacterium]|nr:hypothetical protein [Alphaproteobacteria bacterium]